MRALPRFLATAGAVAAFSLSAAPAALAQQACDDYSGGCAEVGGVVQAPVESGEGGGVAQTPVEGGQGGAVGTVQNNRATPSTLPFTGGEIVLLGATGVGAVAVGALAVRMGRRRNHAAA